MTRTKPTFNRPARRASEGPSPGSVNEVAAAVSAEISRCAMRAGDQAILLQSIGELACEATGEIFRDASPKDLGKHSTTIRGIVTHALAVLAALQCEGGRLDALAALRQAGSLDEDDPI